MTTREEKTRRLSPGGEWVNPAMSRMLPQNLSMLPVTMSDVDHNEEHQDGHSPRKRRRLGSTSHTPRNARDHKQLRFRHESCYRDEYRVLFNDYVTSTLR